MEILLEEARDTIEMLMNGLQWYTDNTDTEEYKDNHKSDDEAFATANDVIRRINSYVEENTCDLVGIKDGVHTQLGKHTVPPRMKLRAIIENYIGRVPDDYEEDFSDAGTAMIIGEAFYDWLVVHGWKPQPPQIYDISSIREIVEQIAKGMCDPTPTRRMYISNPDAMTQDMWWQDYFTNNDKNVKIMARRALELLK